MKFLFREYSDSVYEHKGNFYLFQSSLSQRGHSSWICIEVELDEWGLVTKHSIRNGKTISSRHNKRLTMEDALKVLDNKEVV